MKYRGLNDFFDMIYIINLGKNKLIINKKFIIILFLNAKRL